MTSERVDSIVVGAGVVGLAIARRLAASGREVLVLEAADAIGTGVSGRNSEVVHAGIYYAPGSLKARLCVEGRRALYAYCAAHGVAHRRVGKLLVAIDEAEVLALERFAATARANGVEEILPLSGAEARTLEPEVTCTRALFSPVSGIVDGHGLMRALRAEAESRRAVVVLRSPVTGGRVRDDAVEIESGAGGATTRLRPRLVVNAAGLGAQAVARAIAGLRAATIPPLHYAKGSYFSLAGVHPFRHLVYPIPGGAGLGVHVTLDLAGTARFGPDVEWVDALDYAVDAARERSFAAAIRRYWPGLPEGALRPAYAGIRPKLTLPGAAAADFRIDGPNVHGVPGLVNLYGIESPGLTACLAIADHVATLLGVPAA